MWNRDDDDVDGELRAERERDWEPELSGIDEDWNEFWFGAIKPFRGYTDRGERFFCACMLGPNKAQCYVEECPRHRPANFLTNAA